MYSDLINQRNLEAGQFALDNAEDNRYGYESEVPSGYEWLVDDYAKDLQENEGYDEDEARELACNMVLKELTTPDYDYF